MTEIIEKFLHEYDRRLDYYGMACLHAREICERILRSAGIKVIVSARAKSPDRLRAKLEQRNIVQEYATIEEIYSDIPDLAGVRLALYFPSQIPDVAKLIASSFRVEKTKVFPKDLAREDERSGHTYVFSGYGAHHLRVYFVEDELTRLGGRFLDCRIEIQVASVLMHAWSEVEHDLVYKEENGTVSQGEVEIIDEVNGIILAGELALKRLFKAQNDRIRSGNRPFSSHYDLASYLEQEIGKTSESLKYIKMGDVEHLFNILNYAGIAEVGKVKSYIQMIQENIRESAFSDSNTIAGSILDIIVEKNPGLDMKIIKGRVSDEGVLQLLASFAAAHKALFRLSPVTRLVLKELQQRNLVSENEVNTFLSAQKLRNLIIHGGTEEIPPKSLSEMIAVLNKVEEVVYEKITELWVIVTDRLQGSLNRLAAKLNDISATAGTIQLRFETNEDSRKFRVVVSGQVCVGEDQNGIPVTRNLIFDHTDWEENPRKAWRDARNILDDEYRQLKSHVETQEMYEPDGDDYRE